MVAWITLGIFHIPHTEDVPIVQTTGVQMSFWLMPYNYFNEDPTLASRDNVRIDFGEEEDTWNHSGQHVSDTCLPRTSVFKGEMRQCSIKMEEMEEDECNSSIVPSVFVPFYLLLLCLSLVWNKL